MKTTATVERDGRLTINADVLQRAGLRPGDRVELEQIPAGFVVARGRDADSVFARWAGMDRTSAPKSIDELVAEIRRCVAMTTWIDTNVLIALWNANLETQSVAREALRVAAESGWFAISGCVYAELLAGPGRTVRERMRCRFRSWFLSGILPDLPRSS